MRFWIERMMAARSVSTSDRLTAPIMAPRLPTGTAMLLEKAALAKTERNTLFPVRAVCRSCRSGASWPSSKTTLPRSSTTTIRSKPERSRKRSTSLTPFWLSRSSEPRAEETTVICEERELCFSWNTVSRDEVMG